MRAPTACRRARRDRNRCIDATRSARARDASRSSFVVASVLLPALVFEQELSAQQSARIVRYALQQVIERLTLFLRRVVFLDCSCRLAVLVGLAALRELTGRSPSKVPAAAGCSACLRTAALAIALRCRAFGAFGGLLLLLLAAGLLLRIALLVLSGCRPAPISSRPAAAISRHGSDHPAAARRNRPACPDPAARRTARICRRSACPSTCSTSTAASARTCPASAGASSTLRPRTCSPSHHPCRARVSARDRTQRCLFVLAELRERIALVVGAVGISTSE